MFCEKFVGTSSDSMSTRSFRRIAIFLLIEIRDKETLWALEGVQDPIWVFCLGERHS